MCLPSWPIRQSRACRRLMKLNPAQRAARRVVPDRFVAGLLVLVPRYVKLGQILSARPDVLSAKYIATIRIVKQAISRRAPRFDSQRMMRGYASRSCLR